MSGQDLGLFRDQFEAQLLERPGLKAYPAPPTTLANSVTLSGKVYGYAVREQTAEGMVLRSIDVALEVSVRVGAEKEPALVLSRLYAYQKLYRSPEGMPPLDFDLRNAARETTGSVLRILAPGKVESPQLVSAVDTDNGIDYGHPLLARGSREAGFGRIEAAVAAWSVLLYAPESSQPAGLYRVSPRTLARLAQAGAQPPDVDALKPLLRSTGQPLESLRDSVVKALAPNSPWVPTVLQRSDEAVDRAQLNLARAHQNLSEVYRVTGRLDLAAYHLSRAYAFDPRQATLDTWVQLQAQRDVIPKSVQGHPEEALPWMQAYSRVPAPFTATVSGGAYERNVLPAPAFPPGGSPVPLPPLPPPRAAQPVLMPAAAPVPVSPAPGARNPPAGQRARTATPPASPRSPYGQSPRSGN
jgi:hypothetical protein